MPAASAAMSPTDQAVLKGASQTWVSSTRCPAFLTARETRRLSAGEHGGPKMPARSCTGNVLFLRVTLLATRRLAILVGQEQAILPAPANLSEKIWLRCRE